VRIVRLDDAGWGDFLSEVDLAGLVPDELARYRPAVVDAIVYFLDHLEPARASEILCDQALMADDASAEERLVAIARHCPALHKLGQVMARDRRLPLSFREHLQGLESMAPAPGTLSLRDALEKDLGPLADHGLELDDDALAEASVALVVPFTWRSSHGDAARQGVFKVLKPGIEAKLEEELSLFRAIGAHLDEQCHAYGVPEIAYESTFEQVRDLLRFEVHLDQEQAHLRAARTAYRGLPAVLIPEVMPFCTPRVTAMERVFGRKVTEVDGLPAKARRDLASLIAEAMIARPIWSAGPETMFHADPHAGNLFLADDGRLAILDWSLVGTLRKEDQVRLCQILFGAMTADPALVTAAVADLAEGSVDAEALRCVVSARLGALRGRLWPNLTWLTGLLDDAVTRGRARFRTDLVGFRKVLQTVSGVVADISDHCDPDRVLIATFLGRMAREWGRRMTSMPFSRDFSTHVSNADLAQLLTFAPLAATHGWWERLLLGNPGGPPSPQSDAR
jgi:ubiquinone biosynthesis protein